MDAISTGKIIRESRMKKGMTQQVLAETVNVSATAISKWENGHSLPDITMLEPLSLALDLSISELVLGERSEEKVENKNIEVAKKVAEEVAIKSVIGESIRQRKKAVLTGVLNTTVVVAVFLVAFLLLFEIGIPAKQDNIRVKTEIQNNYGYPEWVINFETVNGQPIYAYTEATTIKTEDGEKVISGRIIHLRVAPLGHLNPNGYTWGYSMVKDEGQGLTPTEEYDFVVIVDYADGDTSYSMQDEGMFR